MEQPTLTREEVAARGKAIYAERIQAAVEPGNLGKFLVIDVVTGEYEMGDDDVAVMKRAAARHPAQFLYGMRIGQRTMGRIGPARGSQR